MPLILDNVSVGAKAVLDTQKLREGKIIRERKDVKWRNKMEVTAEVRQLAMQLLEAAGVPEETEHALITLRFVQEVD